MTSIAAPDSKVFKRVVTGAILLNAAVFVWDLLDGGHHELAEQVESVILWFFLLELLWRLRRHGWAFLRGWGLFDAVVILLALVPVLPVNPAALLLVRVARLARLLHLGRHSISHLGHSVSHLRLWRLARPARVDAA
jgi:hypothetical protein